MASPNVYSRITMYLPGYNYYSGAAAVFHWVSKYPVAKSNILLALYVIRYVNDTKIIS